MSNLWNVSADKFINEKESIMRMGNVYQISNGYMGYRGTLDEFGPDELVGITIAGIFDRVEGSWREPVNAPNGGFTQLTVDGNDISALTSTIKEHTQNLQLENAVFQRETTYETEEKTITVNSVRFLSAATPNLGVIKYIFTTDKVATVKINTGIDCNIWDLNGKHLIDMQLEKSKDALLVHAVTNELGKKVAVAETVDITFGKHDHTIAGNKNLHTVEVVTEAGKTYTFYKYFAVFTENDGVAAVNDTAIKTVTDAKVRGYEKCLADHNATWEKKWEYCDVKIDGDDEAQQALRYSIFQLLIVAPVKGSANSIPARALSGQVYKGAIFWDTEMFMFPFFLYTYPEKAVELMRYRIKTLDGARRKAKTEGVGFEGAFYAWESQDDGDDACTYFNIGDPNTGRDLRTHFRDKQVHISGDVAIAMWEYFKLTGDDSLLLEGGAEVILECARFYFSYAYYNSNKNRYEVLDVIGPDEYHERVNNNAFTNMVAKATFEIANATVKYLKEKHPDVFKTLIKKINISGELHRFVEAEKLIYVPEPNHEGVIEQFDAYFKLKDTSIKELKAQMIHPNEYLGAGQGLAVPTKVIKQADVIMMLNMFKGRYSKEIKKANWEYYEPRTEHGSSLSACAYAMVATEFGDLDFAYEYFLKTAKIDIEAKYKVYVGTIFMGGSHPAANGGAWMTAVFGFGGVQSTADTIIINPRLYKKWNQLQFNIIHQGNRFVITINKNEVIIISDATNMNNNNFIIAGQQIKCGVGKTAVIKY